MNLTIFKPNNARHKHNFRALLSLLLVLVMALGMLPVSALATDPETQVHVIVENTTYSESAGAPWDGRLVDTWVTIDELSTMMSCVVAALGTVSATQVGAESGYISSINGLGEFDGGSLSGWMGTLNDWFTNEGFTEFTVAKGTLAAGDEIRIMYTCDYGADLGGTWGSTDNSVKAVTFSAGELDTDFSSSTYSYTLTLPAGTESLIVTPTATNKNYQVRTYLGTQVAGTEYKRTAAIPVENGSVITVVCGAPTWPSMNSSSAAKIYTFSIAVAAASTEPVFEIQAGSDDSYASIPGGTLSYNVGNTPARLKVVQTGGSTVTPTKYKWKQASTLDGALGSAGSSSKTNKVNYLPSTAAMGETWFACEVTYTPEGGEETTVTVGRVKVSVNLTQAALEEAAGFSPQPVGGSWGYGNSGDGVEDYGAILQAMPDNSFWGEGSSMVWKVSSNNGESWTETSDYGTDPIGVGEMGDYYLTLYTLPAGNYKFKAVATFKTSDLVGTPLTATVDSTVVDVTIIDTSIDMDGEGTEASPYLIKTSADLQKVSEMTAVTDFKGIYFKFDANITLPAGWTPIGTDKNRFSGNIDGDGHLLTIPENEKSLIGCPKEATLKNLNIYGTKINGNGVVAIYTTGVKGVTAITIENVTLKSGTQTLGAGFVSGYAPGDYPVVIRNCTVEAGVVIGYDGTMSNIGSFGGDYNGTIIGCVSHATVKGVNYVGGISGSKGQTMGDYIIVDCIFDGEVIATGDNVGGVSGGGYAGTSFGIVSAPNTPCATIINCLVSGSVSGVNNVGGILGAEPGVKECWNNGVGYIQNNLFTGTLTASGENEGGIIGYMSCINSMNVISGNFYREGCGATLGIGAAGMVETPETSGSFGSGWNTYTLSGKKYGRTDDPMGAGAAALAGSCTATELTDGTVLAALNSGYGSSKNWTAGTGFPTFTAYNPSRVYRIVCTTLSTMNGVTQEANGTDILAGKELTLRRSDGTSTILSATDASVTKGYTITKDMIGSYIPASLFYDGHQFVFNLGINNTLPVRKDGVDDAAADTATAGRAWTLDLRSIFTDPDGDELTYKVKIDSASYVDAVTNAGVYAYTPDAAGSVTLKFKANDGTKDSTQTYTVALTVEEAVSYTTALNAVLPYIRTTVTNPTVSSTSGEWAVFALNRGGASTSEWNEKYLANLKTYVDNCDGVLHAKKYTEYSRVVLALTSMGMDASAFKTSTKTYDLVSPLLDKQTNGAYWAEWQGNNGTCFALLALDSNNYLNNSDGKAARAALIKSLKDAQLASGAWGISGTTPDLDMTAAGVYALAPYYLSEAKPTALGGSVTHAELKVMVDSALAYLSGAQNASGGFGSAEADVWALIALASVGRDADTDTAFVKTGGSLLDDLLSYYDKTTGGFKHLLDGTVNQMATEQAAYGLVAYDRYKNGKNILYDMTDAFAKSTETGVTSVSVGGTAGTINGTTITVELPYGTTLPTDSSAVSITLTDSKASASTPATADNGATWTFTVTAEDGVTATYTVTVHTGTGITVKVGVYDYTAKTYGSDKASASGVVLSERTVTVPTGSTALDAIKAAMGAANISYVINSSYNYVSDVGGLAEYGCGSESGWMFRVNNNYGNMGANVTTLAAGDVLEWHYSVVGYGTDVGSYWEGGPVLKSFSLNGTAGTVVTEGHAGTEGDPYVINVTLPSGSTKTGKTATLTSTLHPEYQILTPNVLSAQNYTNDLTFKLYTDGGFYATWYTVKVSVESSGGTPTDNKITVTFRLIGAEQATQDVDLSTSSYLPAYVTWVPTTTYTLNEGSTVYDLYIKAMSAAGLSSVGANKNYVETINAPSSLGGYELSEFTNGKYSGWMYTIDGSHPGYGLKEQTLSDGDVVIWHYVNDYRHEVRDWFNDAQYPALGDGTYYSGWLKATDILGGKSTGSTPSNPNNPSNPGSTSPTIEPSVTPGSGGSAAATVTEKQVDDAIKAVGTTGSTITIATDTSAAKVTISIPTAAAKDVVDDTNSALAIETATGTVTIPNAALSSIVSQASGSKIDVSVETRTTANTPDGIDTTDAIIEEIAVTSGDKKITTFAGQSIDVSIPVSSGYKAGESYRVVVISADGSAEILYGKCVSVNGKLEVQVEVSHLSTFVVTTKQPMSFTDITNHWAKDAIGFAWDHDLMNGVGGSLFNADGTVNRAMLVTVLYRLEGEPAITSANPFDDVKAGMWYTNAIIWAAENKIVEGYGDAKFGPEDEITREQMATILYRYAGQYKKYDVSKVNDLSAYTDAAGISSYATDTVKWANAQSLVTGRTATTLAPKGDATRAEMATILMRFIENVK